MKGRWIIAAGAGLLALAVALGAFGAHALKARLAPEHLANWRTAVEYQFHHGLGLLLIGLLAERWGEGRAKWPAVLLLLGSVLFSGSLYILSVRGLIDAEALAPLLGPITPLGGLCLVAGWGVLFISAFRQGDRR